MAVTATFTERSNSLVGTRRHRIGKLALSGTYATNGFAVTPQMFGLSVLTDLRFNSPFRNGAAAVAPAWDPTNKKVLLYNTAAAVSTPFAEVTNATSMASYAAESVEAVGY